MNIRLDIEYDGSEFRGWQRQGNLPTVQKSLEDIIERVVGRRVPLRGASRTDSGVHAQMQVANFHLRQSSIPVKKWREIFNTQLPPSIRVTRAFEVSESFNAMTDARSKRYEYRILNRNYSSALDRRVYFLPSRLDWDKVLKSLPYFVGQKDFRAFQGAKATVKSTTRTVTRFELVKERGTGAYKFVVEGNGFLKQMVRTMVGTALEVGEGKRSPADVESVIASRLRRRAGRTAPPQGLCLVKIEYPDA